jgi:predicted glycosyltransferase
VTRKLRIVNYAVNGSGVGHLTRLVAINRWLRRYAAFLDVRLETYFLTSSEADGLLFQEGFASFKLPSKTAIKDAGLAKPAYLALAKQWVWHSLGLLRPDLFVVDTFPRGSFGELLSALDLCKQTAFIYRPLKAEIATRPDFQAMLPLYDAILVPDHADQAASVVPARARERLTHVGPVMVRERVEAAPRDEVRRRLGIPADRLAVYLTAGGGGDPGTQDQLAAAIEALSDDPSLHLVIGAGPLYRGRRVYGERIVWLTGERAAELAAGFDLALGACGYNTFFELMHLGVPTLFRAQPKVADEQDRRAQRAVEAGAGVLLPLDAGPDALRAAVDTMRDPDVRAAMSEAARRLVPANHARDAAAELLRLCLPSHEVDAAEEALGDDLLGAASELELDLEPFLSLMAALDPSQAWRLNTDAAGQAAELATELLRFVARLGVPYPAALRVIDPLLRKLPRASLAERALAARRVLQALTPFEDWAGAAMLVNAFRREKELAVTAFADALARFLDDLRRRELDLYGGLAELARAQGDGEPPTNAELLRGVASSRTGERA